MGVSTETAGRRTPQSERVRTGDRARGRPRYPDTSLGVIREPFLRGPDGQPVGVRHGDAIRCVRNSRMERSSLNEAAAVAPFPFYEPAAPPVRDLRAGGFGWDEDVPLHLAVDGHLADGTEVSVDTQLLGRRASHSSLPARIADLVWHHLVGGEVEVALPMSLRVEAEDHEIAVDGRSVRFAGARLAGSQRWTGTADIDDVRVIVTIDGPSRLSAIATCARLELPDGGAHGA
jgi:hypothetical protein